ncbi:MULTISPECIES: ABC transporter permease [unclassified Bradyrhizobium]|uniref:ABC transporter permease n=1 Tax=unclassified Bradyrhizobium TaxID=2631580 RepID=UPI00247AA757|nr:MULTISPECIES: ABC transporter permease [unclassified Bradyrhizobium]WGR68685.1 ABC transporter permease [Bradyrhizobium sp. ISRA426]WGR80740.1 ABC transporter permease [Bradyrhizobium sp. ISRA430]WGR83925.1 ABC transporter permease [Bradyrhizobium sp. ISRA432]
MKATLRLLSRTKLYWGLLTICLIGALTSPHTSSGNNIFLSYANLTDVLRQVSITGLVATGMTMVILLGGIDLSVGSVMGFATVICAMLLTKPGWTAASMMGIPAATLVGGAVVALFVRFVFRGLARGHDVSAGRRPPIALSHWRSVWIPTLIGVAVAIAIAWWLTTQVQTKFGVLGVLLIAPCLALLLGAINGFLIVSGRLQPFIVTLAMMVSALGVARLTAGQDNAVVPVYTGTNATEAFEMLRSMLWGVLPVPSVFFLAAIVLFGAILRFTSFGRYAYAIGGNVEAAKLSGIKVAQVQLTAYLISGLLAGIAGVLFVAQYRQGKPDAGAGLELDAIAAVVIGGTSLMGGRGGLAGTFVGVLIFGLLSDILQLQNIDSNVQLLMKGLIIVCTVLVQEQNLGQLMARWRFSRSGKLRADPKTAESYRLPGAAKAQFAREDLDEAS